MTTREIQGHLEEVYGVGVSPTPTSNVTDAVAGEVRAWRNRPLNAFLNTHWFLSQVCANLCGMIRRD